MVELSHTHTHARTHTHTHTHTHTPACTTCRIVKGDGIKHAYTRLLILGGKTQCLLQDFAQGVEMPSAKNLTGGGARKYNT